MEVTQGILLPVLLAAIVANTVILMLVVVAARISRRERTGPATTRSALEGSLMSTSFVDRSGRPAWDSRSPSGSATESAGTDDADADDADADGADGGDPAGAAAADDLSAGEPADVDGAAAPGPGEGDAPAAASTDVFDTDGQGDTGTDPLARTAAAAATAPGTTGSDIDVLTGLLDQAAFTRLVIAEDVRIHRYHRPATIVIFELEGLDRLVDRLGQDAADRIVPALADTMRRLARDVDHVARLAPGRFGVLLPETDEVAAINYVERVRRACELWLESGAIALRLAAGWAGTTGDPSLVQAQRLAADRMYVELRRESRRAPDR